MDLLSFGIALEDASFKRAATEDAEKIRKLSLSLRDAQASLERYNAKLAVANETGNIAQHERYGLAVQRTSQKVDELGRSLRVAQQESNAGALAAHRATISGYVAIAKAATEAVAAVAAVSAALAIYATKTALDVVNANQRLVASFEALGGAHAGDETLDFLNDLSRRLPQSRSELAQWTKQFQALGITDLGHLRGELRATAAAQAINGDSGAQAYQRLIERVKIAGDLGQKLTIDRRLERMLHEAGVNVDALKDKFGAVSKTTKGLQVDAESFGSALRSTLIERGKGPLEAMSNSLGALETKASETWRHFFDDIDTKPLTDVFKEVISLGDQGEPSGQALKKGITGAVNEIIIKFAQATHAAELFFLDVEIYALEAKIQLNPLLDALERLGILGKGAPTVAPSLSNGERGGFAAVGSARARTFAANDNGQQPGSGGELPARFAGNAAKAALAFGGPGSIPGILAGPAFAVGVELSRSFEAHLAKDLQRPAAPAGFQVAFAPDRGSLGQPASQQANAGPPSVTNSVSVGELHVHAAGDVTDATELSATGLSTTFERLQLVSGR